MWRQATVGSHHLSARGGGFVRLRPLGLVERRGEEEHFIPIPDTTGQAMRGMLVAAVVIPLLLILAARLTRR